MLQIVFDVAYLRRTAPISGLCKECVAFLEGPLLNNNLCHNRVALWIVSEHFDVTK